jgi:tRNA(fMet)-specific endonuclease VapC
MATRQRKKDQSDKLIASHAIALDTVLVTNNEPDFVAYPGVPHRELATLTGRARCTR